MKDPRIKQLAELLIKHSCALKPREKVLIEAINAPREIVIELIRETRAAGATPLVSLKDDQVIRELALTYDAEDVRFMARSELHVLEQANAFISIRAPLNTQEYAGIPGDSLRNLLEHYIQPVHFKYRNDHVKWVALRWPTPAMAERAGLSTEEFEDLYFDLCLRDYAHMSVTMDPLIELLQNTDEVRVVSTNGTNLSFSIKDIGAHKSDGRNNIPDGEVFTAPVRESVNGRIRFNVPSVYYGVMFDNICLEFSDGKIINAVCDREQAKLEEILDQDEGARYVGEFAFGLHPGLRKPVRDILFDEKIAGSVHIAPGNAYSVCDNGNRSAIHWDLILMQTPEMGGGEVYFDGRLVRKDGWFIPRELAALNP
jgi:aminopeptidase